MFSSITDRNSRASRPVFEEESEEDSIATNSTAPSDHDEDESFNVEKILAYESDHESSGQPAYLIKWEGYPLSRASWEPPENIEDDTLFDQWKQDKKRAELGLAKLFDVNDWKRASRELARSKVDRDQRREAKRQKRHMQIESAKEHSENEPSSKRRQYRKQEELLSGDEDVTAAGKSAKPKRTKSTLVNRKGVAQKVKAARTRTISSSEGEHQSMPDGNDDSDLNSLFDQGSQPIYPELHQSSKPDSTTPKPTVPAFTVQARKDPTGVPTTTSEPLKPKISAFSAARKSIGVSHPPAKSSVAPKTAKRSNVFTKPPRKPRGLPRINNHAANDTTGRLFSKLSVQNSIQKHMRAEPAPDPSALTMIDPKTGKALDPNPASQEKRLSAKATRPSAEAQSAYGRRRSPPREQSRRSLSPLAPAPGPRLPTTPEIGRDWSRTKTCWHWTSGTCKFTAETCRFAHWVIDERQPQQLLQHQAPPAPPPPPSKKQTECHFWKRGHCKFTAEECEFAHHPTGIVAGPPGTFKRGFGQSEVPLRSDASLLSGPSTSTNQGSLGRNVDGNGDGGNVVTSFPNADAPLSGAKSPLSTNTTNSERTVRFTLPDASAAATVMPFPDHNFGIRPAQFDVQWEAGSPKNLLADLHMTGIRMFESLLYPVSNGVYFAPKYLVSAVDLQALLSNAVTQGASWPVGSLIAHHESSTIAAQLAECCKLNVSAMVAVQDRYTLILYPNNAEEWKFLDTGTAASPSAALRFCMLPPINDASKRAKILAGMPLHGKQNVEMDGLLFGDSDIDLIPKSSNRPVFICWPEEGRGEMELIAQYMRSLNCKVYASVTPGAWSFFREKYTKTPCTIICHPDTPFHEMPGLHSLLLINSQAKAIEICRQSTDDAREDRRGLFHCQSLLPHGRVIFITDDVFVHHPEKAADIIDLFLKANATKPEGGEHDKIAARPGVKDWLCHLALTSTGDRGRQDPRWMRLYGRMCELYPPDAEDPDDPARPLPSSHLVSFPPDELPSLQGVWESDEARATDMLVNWFAGWSLANAPSFRRFLVCHEPKQGEMTVDENGRTIFKMQADPKGWSEKYGNIGVKRPDELLAEMQKKVRPAKK